MGQSRALESFLSGRVRVLQGDITKQNVDVIVNAANSTLLGEGRRRRDSRERRAPDSGRMPGNPPHTLPTRAADWGGCANYRRLPPRTLRNSYGRADYANRACT